MNFPFVGWIVIAVAFFSVAAVMYFVVKEGDHHDDYFDPDSAAPEPKTPTSQPDNGV